MKQLFWLSLVIFLPYSVADAQTIRVGHADAYEDVMLTLPPGRLADVEVSLKSAGDPLEGFRIYLVRNDQWRAIQAIDSDEHGVINFTNVPARSYTVVLRKTTKQTHVSTVSVGDIRVTLAARNSQAVAKSSENKNP